MFIIYTTWPTVCGHMTITPTCCSSPYCCHKVESTQLSTMSLYATVLRFPFAWTKGPNLFQHNNAPVHKMTSMKKWVAKFIVEEFQSSVQNPDLNLIKQLWIEGVRTWHPYLISLMLLCLNGWISTVRFHYLVESPLRIVDVILTSKEG